MATSDYQSACEGPAAAVDMLNAFQTGMATFVRYCNAFTIPFLISINYFNQVESRRFWSRTPLENLSAYLKLGTMNMELAGRAMTGGLLAMEQFLKLEIEQALPALSAGDTKALGALAKRISYLVEQVAYTYPAAIDGIESEFGFHFERQPDSSLVDETERFQLYQVLPDDPKISVRKDGKPILIIPPFVLGANILSFLPGQKRSYAHAFANQGVPTYIRVLKKIDVNEAVQTMTPEDDALDTRRFCDTIKGRHGAPVTLNGYCQGGYAALCNLLSGELDGLVDAFITCVAPMDGTRSKGLASFLQNLPGVFNDLAYGTKKLPNGNEVADGTLMGWIYKLKSIETETPLLAMWRDMMLVAHTNGDHTNISKTAAALNHWLTYERNDLPLDITRVSFASYNIPISSDGTLPVKLFGRALNLKRLQAKNIRWLICYGRQDDLVEPETALAPLDYIDAEVSAFPKGHVAIATSWSHPESAYALHLHYDREKARGPVRFQLDLQAERDAGAKPAAKPRAAGASSKPAPVVKSASVSQPKRAKRPKAETKGKKVALQTKGEAK